MKTRINKKIIKIAVILILALLTELLFFNYAAIRTYFSKNKNVDFNDYFIEHSPLQNNEYSIYNKDGYSTTDNKKISFGENSLIIQNINFVVSSVNIEYNKNNNYPIIYTLNFKCDGDEYDGATCESKVFTNTINTYFQFNTKSKCSIIKIDISPYYLETDDLEITNIILNKPNFNFHFGRVIIVFFIYLLLYLIYTKKVYKFKINTNKKIDNILFLFIVLLIAVFTFYFYYNVFFDSKYELDEYKLYGKVTLYEDLLENKIHASNLNLADYKKYERYGIAVDKNDNLTYYLSNVYKYLIAKPLYNIFNIYIDIRYINLILLILVILAISNLYKKIISLYFDNISLFNFLLGLIVILLGSNVLFARRQFMIDIYTLINILLLVLGLTICFKIISLLKFKFDIKKLNILYLNLGIICALLLFNTPSAIIYYLLFFLLIRISIRHSSIKFNNIITVSLLILPIIIAFIFISIINYKLFGNIFEYGFSHDIYRLDYPYTLEISYIVKGIIETIFLPFETNLFSFPFVNIKSMYNLYFYSKKLYQHNILGLVSFPIVYTLIFKNLLKRHKEKNSTFIYNVINLFIIFGAILTIFNFCIYGINEICTLELKLLLVTASVLFMLKHMEINESKKEISNQTENLFFTIFSIATIIIVSQISISTDLQLLSITNNNFVTNLKNIFLFWS